MSQIQVRQARVQDASQIVNLYLGWQEFKGILPNKLIAPENKNGLFPYLSGKNSTRLYLVAADQQQSAVGVCYLDTSFEKFQVLRIGDFIVDKKHRGKGVGKQLLEYIKKYSRKKGVKKLWLWTQKELKDAINFYTNNGFSIEGEQKSQFLGKDAVLLGLVLEES